MENLLANLTANKDHTCYCLFFNFMMLAYESVLSPECVFSSHRPFSVPAVHVVSDPALSDSVSILFIIT